MTNKPKATLRDYAEIEHEFNITIGTIQGVMDLLTSIGLNNVPPEDNLAKLGNGMYCLAKDADRLFDELLNLRLAELKIHKAQEVAHG